MPGHRHQHHGIIGCMLQNNLIKAIRLIPTRHSCCCSQSFSMWHKNYPRVWKIMKNSHHIAIHKNHLRKLLNCKICPPSGGWGRLQGISALPVYRIVKSLDTLLISASGKANANIWTLYSPYIRVVVWGGVWLWFVQTQDEQTALDGLQDGLIVWIELY